MNTIEKQLLHTPERDRYLVSIYNETRVPGEAKVPGDLSVSRILERIEDDYRSFDRTPPTFCEMMDMIAGGYR